MRPRTIAARITSAPAVARSAMHCERPERMSKALTRDDLFIIQDALKAYLDKAYEEAMDSGRISPDFIFSIQHVAWKIPYLINELPEGP